MSRTRNLIIGLMMTALLGAVSAQGQVLRGVNDTQVRNLMQRLETRTDNFRLAMDRQMDNTRIDGTSAEDSIMQYINRFENATDELRDSYNARRSTSAEATTVMNYAWYIDDFMRRNRLAANVENQWNRIRADLDTLARYYSVAWNWNRTTPPYGQNFPTANVRVNEAQMRALLRSLETRTNQFRNVVDRRIDRTGMDGTRTEESVMDYVNRFETATNTLRDSFNARRATAAEVTEVLNYGWYIDDFMRRNQTMAARNRLGSNVVNQWNLIRGDLNSLAGYYNVAWNWNRTSPPYGNTFPGGGNSLDSRFTGTYRLNSSMSDNVTAIVNRSITGNSAAAVRQRQNLERRLSSPLNLAIEKNGNQVILATNLYAPVTLVADGRVSSETNARGRTTRTSVTMSGNTLTMNTEGDRANDFWVSFTPISGNRIQMTRRIYLEGRNQQISVSSIYDRVSSVAQWPTVDRNPGWNNTGTTGTVGTFYVPNGTRLTAVLRNRIATNVSQAGDQFTMEVTSPNQYRGAIITGRITEVASSGRVTGRANLAMDFETIRYGNQTYQFAGIIDSAREADGDSISVSNEGTVRDGSQTTTTITRAGIGAALGALIGAIVGGGEGAAIGAGVGAGAGAGTVLIQGRDNINLEAGSQFEITATGPNSNNVGQRW